MHAIAAEHVRFRGESAIRLRSGELAATFLPQLGLTGVSLRFREGEYLALPGGLDHLRGGHTGGLPLLAPWANRLSSRRFQLDGVDVNLPDSTMPTDSNGLPIHGLLVGRSRWSVDEVSTSAGAARLRASIEIGARDFAFPHRIQVTFTAREPELTVTTAVTPSGRNRVPIAFGWHPYLKVPGTPRGQWHLRLPARARAALDERGLPTGVETDERAEAGVIGRRRFDDLFKLGRSGRLAFETDQGRGIELRCDASFPYAQVWVPPGQQFGALEPMTAPTNALVTGVAQWAEPGDTFIATFSLALT